MKKKQEQNPGVFTQQPPLQYYLVEPRHLGGSGDLRHVTEYLRAAGWKDRSKTGGPILFENPESTMRVAYDLGSGLGGWTIRGKATADQPAWRAVFSAQVPVEIVAGFSDALTTPRSAHAPNVWAPLQGHGWQLRPGQHVTAMSPNESAFLQYHQPSGGEVLWWAGAQTQQGRRIWDVTFTSTTPMRFIEAFTAALADPLPVLRPRGSVPPDPRIRITSVSVRPHELAAWQQARLNTAPAHPRASAARPGTSPPHGAASYVAPGGRRR